MCLTEKNDFKFTKEDRVLLIVLTIAAFLAFQLKPDVYSDSSELLQPLETIDFGSYMLLLGIYIVFRYILKKTDRQIINAPVAVVSLLFSLFTVFGYSYEKTDTWNLVIGSERLANTLICIIGYFVFFCFTISLLFVYLENGPQYKADGFSKNTWYFRYLEEKPFLTSFITLTVCYIPCFILFYPGLFMGDTEPQIVQVYKEIGSMCFRDGSGLAGLGYFREKLLDPAVFLNQHHPVAHTMLIHVFVEIGRKLNNLNLGIFFYILFQFSFLSGVISFAIHTLIKKKYISLKVGLLLLAWCVFNPLVNNYMLLITKDIIYGGFFLLELFFFIPLFSENGKIGKKETLCLLFSTTGMIIFRNEAKYLLSFFFVILLITMKRNRKTVSGLLLYTVVFSLLYFQVLMPAVKATPGSIREVLSIPFQQTARYMVCAGDEVTEEERAAIDKVLDYAVLGENYDPDWADPVKNTYRESCSREDLINYFTAWAKMFVKHPTIYIESVLDSYYQFFYFGSKPIVACTVNESLGVMEIANKEMSYISDSRFSHPTLMASGWYEYAREGIFRLPVINLLARPAFYTWILILAIVFSIIRKQGAEILLLPALSVMMALLGPCNGSYGRYMYPAILTLPFVLIVWRRFKKAVQ